MTKGAEKTLWTAILLLCLMIAGVARAAEPVVEAPLLSPKRLSIASGLNYEWRTTPFAGSSEAIEGRHAEWAVGLYGAYNLTPHSSLVASTTLGLDSRQFRHNLGLRVRIWQGAK